MFRLARVGPEPRQGLPANSGVYVITPRLENYLISRATDIQAEMNNLQVTGYEITLTLPNDEPLDLGDLPNPYSVNDSAVLPAAEEDSFSIGATFTVAVPSDYRQPVTAAVFGAGFNSFLIVARATGTTMGGFTQKSGPFYWPVSICDNNCLDLCPTQAAGDALTDEQLGALRDACTPGQDGEPYCTFAPTPEEETP